MHNSSISQWLLILRIFFYLASNPVTCLNNETDLLALLEFKNNLIDPNGVLNSWQWNGTLHYCRWRGISCGSMHRDRVVSINLESQGLGGSVSPHLGNLSFLRSIILQNNSFFGPVPQEFGRLRRLKFVELSNNSFNGEFPRNLSQCSKLYYLNLIDNDLTGAIPPEFSSLFKLEALGLADNRILGTIPSFIGNLTSLRTLSMSTCGLQGEIPETLANLQNLYRLNLAENELTGTVPSGIFNISTINIMFLDFNRLEGTIPSDIGSTLPNLRFFSVGANNYTGAIPVSLSNASFLQYIGFFSTGFTGFMPKHLGRLSYLRNFGIWSTHIQDDVNFISSMINCSELRVLDIFDNFLTGSVPDSIANLSIKLRKISLGGNQLHGNIPSGIGNLVGLSEFSAFLNLFSGPVPSTFGRLEKMQELNLGGNRFSNALPSSLGNLTLLNRLFLVRNNFSGTIPPSLGNCSNLFQLDLSENSLSGSIPREVMSIFSLSIYLDFSYNDLMGSIPSEVGLLGNLGDLDFSNNRLSGEVPSSLGRCISLQRLHLKSNSFHGEIPQALRGLHGLQDLDLSNNNFSGPIPTFLGEFDLVQLNLSFNKFQGAVPIEGIFGNESVISLEGNTELCGGIPELNLVSCPSTDLHKKRSHTLLKILIPIAGAGAISIAILLCSFLLIHRKTMSINNVHKLFGAQFERLSYGDLLRATDGFNESNIIGSGRFGSVYKGILNDGFTLVAIKVLNNHVQGAFKTFMSECIALRGVRHRNLLKILSITLSVDFQGNDFTALVYQYMSNGSLDQWLHGGNSGEGNLRYLTLMKRLNIAIDIASALEYLHNGTDSVIVHGDLKPGNILLDDDMNALLGDFGLSKVISNFSSNMTSNDSNSIAIKGTIGYIAPEYGMVSMVSTQGDVYSYGIFLLELFTNIRPTSDQFHDYENLHNFLHNHLTHHVMEIIDPLIAQTEGDAINSSIREYMRSIMMIGVACSKELPKERLSMADVVVELKRIRIGCLAQGLS